MPKFIKRNLLVSALTLAMGCLLAKISSAHPMTEWECLALNAYWEARNQSLEGMVAVSFVVKNRVNDPRWPDTICGVVQQQAQFSWYWDGLSDTPVNDYKAWEWAKIVADRVLNDPQLIDPTGGANHYHAEYVAPTWSLGMVFMGKIGAHLFYDRRGNAR